MKVGSRKLLAKLLILTGVVTLGILVVPILHSSLISYINYRPKLIDPTAVSRTPAPQVLGIFGDTRVDYTDPSAWFSGSNRPVVKTNTKIKYYSLSIPKLELYDVPVEIDGTDLKKNAIQYPGTALPGSYGNPVVFGHSALPQFYRKSDPHTIFNPLPKIKLGDEIVVNYDGVKYRYVVRETMEVKPTQIEVLGQRYDRMEITLITCVPLGTYWRRFVVVGELLK